MWNRYTVYRFSVDFSFEQVGIVDKGHVVDLPFEQSVLGRDLERDLDENLDNVYFLDYHRCVNVVVGRIQEQDVAILTFDEFSKRKLSSHLKSFLALLPSELHP
jgi:hypothetical protein